jgi:hypothetical protein
MVSRNQGRYTQLPCDREASLSDDRRNVSNSSPAEAKDAAAAAPGDMTADADLEARQEELLDEAVQETFPASDPISVAVPRHRTAR